MQQNTQLGLSSERRKSMAARPGAPRGQGVHWGMRGTVHKVLPASAVMFTLFGVFEVKPTKAFAVDGKLGAIFGAVLTCIAAFAYAINYVRTNPGTRPDYDLVTMLSYGVIAVVLAATIPIIVLRCREDLSEKASPETVEAKSPKRED